MSKSGFSTDSLGVLEEFLVGQHEIDEKKHRSYVLSVNSDQAAAVGELERAKELMREAAGLNAVYSIRAQYVGLEDKRRIRLGPSIRRLLLPFILEAGFSPDPPGQWKENRFLQRHRAGYTHSLYLGRVKFGGQLAFTAARFSDASSVEYFDWHRLNMREGALAYRTQTEVEAACVRWRDILEDVVFPWFDSGVYRVA